MNWFRSLADKLFHRSRIEDDMDEELRSHIQHRADYLERSGLNRAGAERRARIEFGGRERFKDECREALGANFVETPTGQKKAGELYHRVLKMFRAKSKALQVWAVGDRKPDGAGSQFSWCSWLFRRCCHGGLVHTYNPKNKVGVTKVARGSNSDNRDSSMSPSGGSG